MARRKPYPPAGALANFHYQIMVAQHHQRPRNPSAKHGQRETAAPSSPVPISAPRVEPLPSRPAPRSQGSLPEPIVPTFSNSTTIHSSSNPLPEYSASSFFADLSSSFSSTSSFASLDSSSSRSTICMDDEETCESSLSEPDLDLGFGGLKGDPLALANMVSVPVGTRVREFVGEGSANVVVKVDLPEGTPIATQRLFEGKLLRLQKVAENPEKQPYPYLVQYRYWRERIKPMFSDKDDLVPIDLVHLGSGASQILEDVDELLRLLDRASSEEVVDAVGQSQDSESWKLLGLNRSQFTRRKKKFVGSRLARVEHAMLVDDMRVDEKDGIMIEMKPKWLFQSPSAPHASLRCRTCAVRLHRRLKEPSYDSADLPCPLLMASDDWEDRSSFVSSLLPEADLDEWYVEPLMRWFKATPGSASGPKRLVAHLRNLQQQLDTHGPLGEGVDGEDFRLAMTLRDCSVFLRVLKRGNGQAPKVVAKIADLDKKNSEAKSGYWRRTEAELIARGAYTGQYRVDAQAGRVVPMRTGCLMERSSRRSSQWREFKTAGAVGENSRLITDAELGQYIA
ncbi:uncharacterized protein DNG_01554 [Cephalotrichum gorgonifer]|uniref:Inositol-pentakisphosphate 2-kinase n=1 Tax=Cephalotrichum gorgonifer TaxID=2041049 RepID=A0AAE8SRR8_9PEZI|nr:uncharacterized protein DNG_01554 [Cephalotrichum gorgonifer]